MKPWRALLQGHIEEGHRKCLLCQARSGGGREALDDGQEIRLPVDEELSQEVRTEDKPCPE